MVRLTAVCGAPAGSSCGVAALRTLNMPPPSVPAGRATLWRRSVVGSRSGRGRVGQSAVQSRPRWFCVDDDDVDVDDNDELSSIDSQRTFQQPTRPTTRRSTTRRRLDDIDHCTGPNRACSFGCAGLDTHAEVVQDVGPAVCVLGRRAAWRRGRRRAGAHRRMSATGSRSGSAWATTSQSWGRRLGPRTGFQHVYQRFRRVCGDTVHHVCVSTRHPPCARSRLQRPRA